jgi:hypothetical protein
MDLERDDRLRVVSLLVGFEVYWNKEEYPDEATPEEHQYLYPGPSSKDIRINRWMHSCLIEFYLNGEGLILNDQLGLISKAAQITAKRAARKAAREAKIAAAERAKSAKTSHQPQLGA